MKPHHAILLVCLMTVTSCRVNPRSFSREEKQKRMADSLRIVDSLHVVDSVRIADSIMISRYQKADSVRVKEREEKRIADERLAAATAVAPSPEKIEYESDDDIVSARTIAVDSTTPYARLIDSLETEHDHINNQIHDYDEHFKTMKIFPVSEKKRYIEFLLRNKLKDTVEIAAYCSDIEKLYKIRFELLCAIQNSQEGNARIFLQSHIERHKRKMAELTELLLIYSSDVPYLQHHDVVNGYSESEP